MNIRNYKSDDYDQIEALYNDSSTFGGQFDENRDTKERLDNLAHKKPSAILVAEHQGSVVGTVTVLEDGRSCWLYRFAVKDNDQYAAEALLKRAKEVAKQFGHSQFLVYAPEGDVRFEERYIGAGFEFEKGGNYTCYWMNT